MSTCSRDFNLYVDDRSLSLTSQHWAHVSNSGLHLLRVHGPASRCQPESWLPCWIQTGLFQRPWKVRCLPSGSAFCHLHHLDGVWPSHAQRVTSSALLVSSKSVPAICVVYFSESYSNHRIMLSCQLCNPFAFFSHTPHLNGHPLCQIYP